jgi:hypothetical protein
MLHVSIFTKTKGMQTIFIGITILYSRASQGGVKMAAKKAAKPAKKKSKK